MNKFLITLFLLISNCQTGELKVIADLPLTLKEVSGTETTKQSNLIWTLNDGGNKPRLYGLDSKGRIIKALKINAKNHDWEDLASDKQGNLYIGDFGNNLSKRKNLTILKISVDSLSNSKSTHIERISFRYSNQEKFPPKKKSLHFDCEAFFYFNDSLYLFTKSRVKGDFGKTFLYKIPATKGHHVATLESSFNSCSEVDCWMTSADISDDGKSVVLLSPKSIWLFTDFKNDDFFNGTITEIPLNYGSQKEGVCFKDNSILYVTDEKAHGAGGNLYEFVLNR